MVRASEALPEETGVTGVLSLHLRHHPVTLPADPLSIRKPCRALPLVGLVREQMSLRATEQCREEDRAQPGCQAGDGCGRLPTYRSGAPLRCTDRHCECSCGGKQAGTAALENPGEGMQLRPQQLVPHPWNVPS
jgi:hypothetical protein